MECSVKQEINPATHNRVLLGHRGVNFHLALLLAMVVYEDLYQGAHTMEVQFLYAVIKTRKLRFKNFVMDKRKYL